MQTIERVEMERNTLRLLCSVLIKPGTRVEICSLLGPGVFQDPLRRTVFEEVCAVGAEPSKRLRELLPERMVERGYIDFDLKKLLAPMQVTEREIEKLFESALRLLELSEPGDSEEFTLEL
jgi:hypothetical protein